MSVAAGMGEGGSYRQGRSQRSGKRVIFGQGLAALLLCILHLCSVKEELMLELAGSFTSIFLLVRSAAKARSLPCQSLFKRL